MKFAYKCFRVFNAVRFASLIPYNFSHFCFWPKLGFITVCDTKFDYFSYFNQYHSFSFGLVGDMYLYSDEKDSEDKAGVGAE